MLVQIQIRNFAIVEKLDLDLHAGLNVVTGETGAGKSIVVDALTLALGERADSGMVRHGSDRAEVSAVFDLKGIPQALAWMREQALEDETGCIIRRAITSDGRSRAFINGTAVALQQLRDLGAQLVDIHGQHAHQSLLKNAVQRDLLDRFGAHTDLVMEVAEQFRLWQQTLAQWHSLQQSAEERERQIGLLRHQVEELRRVDVAPGELERLEQDHAKLAHANRLLETGQNALRLLEGDDQLDVLRLVNQSAHELSGLIAIDQKLAPIAELINTASIQLQEATAELRHYCNEVDLDPQRLQEVEERIGAVLHLTRKHRLHADELPGLLQRLQQELDLLTGSDERRENLQAEIEQLRKKYLDVSGKLSRKRQLAAKRLGEQITAAMQQLGMPGGRFEVELEPLDAGQYNAHGVERVQFNVSANPGQPVKALAKVASGGELSRISLAIQVSLSHLTDIPTLIYDEVDVGIGGGTAEVVGRQLRALSENRQVITVTHLPQVAAQGHHHFRVSKHIGGGVTRTEMTELDAPQRTDEIARMLGGLELTEQTKAHAREMLARAGAAKTPEPAHSDSET